MEEVLVKRKADTLLSIARRGFLTERTEAGSKPLKCNHSGFIYLFICLSIYLSFVLLPPYFLFSSFFLGVCGVFIMRLFTGFLTMIIINII